MTAATACLACGVEQRAGARFCDGCGSRVVRAHEHAEYRHLTVLFADVVDSMGLAAAVDAQRQREIVTELLTRSTGAIQRYGGTAAKFTGNGIKAVFGLPVAMEDHAFRASLAALAIQSQASELAKEVYARDGIDLQLRAGLSSGRVIVGEGDSGATGYTAIRNQLGMARQMESAAPPGGVMLSQSTAQLIDGAAVLGEPETVPGNGADQAVCARRLLGLSGWHGKVAPAESNLVGRRSELAAIEGWLQRAVDGHGATIAIVGSAGVGKGRLVRETAAMAAARGVDVFTVSCESHASEIAFHVVARLLRAASGVGDLEGPAARAQVRAQAPDADPEDLALFNELLGIADPDVTLPQIDPDARQRRLTALVNTASLARRTPAVYVVQDAHWIDEVSESMLAEFVTVIPQTPSLVLVTYRPEYRGALSRVAGAETIALAPLSDSATATLVSALLGPDASVCGMAALVADRVGGNPFFAEQMVRELAGRGVLRGERGAYVSTADIGELSVPATLQATIAARIDRLDDAAKRALSAAAVIGPRFTPDLLEALGIDPALRDLVAGEFVDQIRFARPHEYVFHHPSIRTVAYEAQPKSERAELHRRVAAAIESCDPTAAEANAALIAEHLEVAGDLPAAFGWRMRAAAWATNRDIVAARLSWERATRIADAVPADHPDRETMRIAPRTMLCGTAFRVHADVSAARSDELRELCTAAGKKASLAIGMAGLVMDHAFHGRLREASQLASEAWALTGSIDDPTLRVGLSMPLMYGKGQSGEWGDVLRWSHAVIELADGNPSRADFIIGSPLALAFAMRAIARYYLGRPGWRHDMRSGLAIARGADPLSCASVAAIISNGAIPSGVLRPDDSVMREIEDGLTIAGRVGDDFALSTAKMTLGLALVHRRSDAERDRGRAVLAQVREEFVRRNHLLCDLPIVDVYLAREMARHAGYVGALPLMRAAVDRLFGEGRLLVWGVPATGVLVNTLLDNRTERTEKDISEAEAAIERLAAAPTVHDLAVRDIWLLRSRALLARARGDAAAYAQFRDRYRDLARALKFEGHLDWAETMP